MTVVLCELELTIKRVKVSTTPDGRVMDLFFITDTRYISNTGILLVLLFLSFILGVFAQDLPFFPFCTLSGNKCIQRRDRMIHTTI